MSSPKENSISARIQRRKPVIGEKSSGGKTTSIMYTNFSIPPPADQYTAGVACVKQSTTKPMASSRNLIRARKQYYIPGVSFIHTPIVGPEKTFFRKTVIVYHHKKDDMPRKKTLKNCGICYFSDIKNDQRRKSSKGKMKKRINVKDYQDH